MLRGLRRAEPAVRADVLEFLARHQSADLIDEIMTTSGLYVGPLELLAQQEMALRGWYGLSWPTANGGSGASTAVTTALVECLEYYLAPRIPPTAEYVAPMIIRHGTAEQQADWLPQILDGRMHVALGYSEPEAGTDLASLRSRARRAATGWTLDGEKVWNSHAHRCTHELLALRTGSVADRHRGVSLFLVPIDLKGISYHEIETWGDVRTNRLVLDGVEVPDSALLGEVDQGWRCIVGALERERISLGTSGHLLRLFDEFIAAARWTQEQGRAVSEETMNGLRTYWPRLLGCHRLAVAAARRVDEGEPAATEACMLKVSTTELRSEFAAWAIVAASRFQQLPPGSLLESLPEWLYRRAPFHRFGGGTNEVLRDIIAQRGIGLTRAADPALAVDR